MELRYSLPERAKSINELKGRHWTVTFKAMQSWRDAVGWAWKLSPASERAELAGKKVRVRMTIPFDCSERQWTGKKRDPHNYVDTVVKATVDQLVKQGAFPDDSHEYVTVDEPVLVRGKEVVVELVPT